MFSQIPHATSNDDDPRSVPRLCSQCHEATPACVSQRTPRFIDGCPNDDETAFWAGVYKVNRRLRSRGVVTMDELDGVGWGDEGFG